MSAVLVSCDEDNVLAPPEHNFRWRFERNPHSEDLLGVWGSSASNVFAVGESGIILHSDGYVWSRMTTPSSVTLYGVWGSGPNDVFAVGDAGTILHYDGTQWREQESGTTALLLSVSGTSGSDVYAIASRELLHYDGNQWRPVGNVPEVSFRDVSVDREIIHYGVDAPVTHAYAVDVQGGFSCYDGRAWKPVFYKSNKVLYGVYAANFDCVVGVGGNGYLFKWDGSTATAFPSGTNNTLWDVWGNSPLYIMAVGTNGTIVRFDGTTCSLMGVYTTNDLTDITGFADDQAVAVGLYGTILRYSH